MFFFSFFKKEKNKPRYRKARFHREEKCQLQTPWGWEVRGWGDVQRKPRTHRCDVVILKYLVQCGDHGAGRQYRTLFFFFLHLYRRCKRGRTRIWWQSWNLGGWRELWVKNLRAFHTWMLTQQLQRWGLGRHQGRDHEKAASSGSMKNFTLDFKVELKLKCVFVKKLTPCTLMSSGAAWISAASSIRGLFTYFSFLF